MLLPAPVLVCPINQKYDKIEEKTQLTFDKVLLKKLLFTIKIIQNLIEIKAYKWTAAIFIIDLVYYYWS